VVSSVNGSGLIATKNTKKHKNEASISDKRFEREVTEETEKKKLENAKCKFSIAEIPLAICNLQFAINSVPSVSSCSKD